MVKTSRTRTAKGNHNPITKEAEKREPQPYNKRGKIKKSFGGSDS